MSSYRRRGFGSSRIRYLGTRGRGRGYGGRGRDHGGQDGTQFNHQSEFLENEENGQGIRREPIVPQNLDFVIAGHSRDGSTYHAHESTRRNSRENYNQGHEQRSPSQSPIRHGNNRGNNRTERGSRPSHLKGAQIGLWYRDRAKRGQSSSSNASGSSVPSKGLKGKQIGLWHRDKPEKNLFAANMGISLSLDRQTKIMSLLELLGTPSSGSFDFTEADPQEPSTSNSFHRHYLENVEANSAPRDGESLFDTTHSSYPIPIENSRDPSLDYTLAEELQSKLASNLRYQDMLKDRRSLPAYECMNDILDLVIHNQVVVISGETGSGKTTQVGQFILDRWILDGNGSICNIVCTQPRRISAISVAQRVADERNESVGGKSIGYSIRLESKLPKRRGGTITFCTTGVILQYMKEDPFLNKVSHIIIDEIHERDVLCDFLLAIIKDLIPKRPDVKIILMSATLNAPHFQKYFDNCPLYHISGFMYPVSVHHLEDVIEMTNFIFPQKVQVRFDTGRSHSKGNRSGFAEQQNFEQLIGPYIRSVERSKLYSRGTISQLRRQESEELCLDLIEAVIQHICTTDVDGGAILVFLPGYDNISNLHKQLSMSGRYSSNQYIILPLHSMMPTVNQREVFDRPPPGKRKIIIATNIAETSITIDDIVYVIDCGKIKMTNFDIELNMETLKPEWVSLANAKQRRGRAGRTQAGVCYHLFTKGREALMEDFMKPEVLRKRLEEVVLQIKMLKLGMAFNFFSRLLDPPDERSVQLAIKRLVQLNALDLQENLTPLGYHLGQLPMDPMTGRMILLGAIFSCCDPILSVAASLSFKDAFVMPMGQEKNVDMVREQFANGTKSDHLVLVRALSGYEDAKLMNTQRDYCFRNFLSSGTLNMLINLKGQFAQNLFDQKLLPSVNWRDPHVNVNSGNDALVKAIICAGLYPNVGKVRVKKFPVIYTVEDGRVNIHPKSVNAREKSFESPFVVYHHKMKSSSVFLHDTTMVSPFPLIFFGGQLNFLNLDGFDTIEVDETVKFHCPENIYVIIQQLRGHLDRLLEEKIRNPGPTFWNKRSKDGDLLRAIVELITAENKEIMNEEPVESDSDSDFPRN